MSEDCPLCNGKEVADLEDLDFSELCPLHYWLLLAEAEGIA